MILSSVDLPMPLGPTWLGVRGRADQCDAALHVEAQLDVLEERRLVRVVEADVHQLRDGGSGSGSGSGSGQD